MQYLMKVRTMPSRDSNDSRDLAMSRDTCEPHTKSPDLFGAFIVCLVAILIWMIHIQLYTNHLWKLQQDNVKMLRQMSTFDSMDLLSPEYGIDVEVSPVYSSRDKRDTKHSGLDTGDPADRTPHRKERGIRRTKQQHNTPGEISESEERELFKLVRTFRSLYKAVQNVTTAGGATLLVHEYGLAVHLVPHDNENIISNGSVRWMEAEQPGSGGNLRDKFFSVLDVGDQQVLKCLKAGRYYIYGQVTFNGRRNQENLTTISCAYSVRVQNYAGSSSRRILFSSTTQHRLGRMVAVTGKRRYMYAHDTVSTGGVFILQRGDVIHSEIIPQNPCDVLPDSSKTFFGAYLLSLNV